MLCKNLKELWTNLRTFLRRGEVTHAGDESRILGKKPSYEGLPTNHRREAPQGRGATLLHETYG